MGSEMKGKRLISHQGMLRAVTEREVPGTGAAQRGRCPPPPVGAVSEVVPVSTALRDQVGARVGWRSKVLGGWGLVGKLLARRNIYEARKQEPGCNSTSLKHGK